MQKIKTNFVKRAARLCALAALAAAAAGCAQKGTAVSAPAEPAFVSQIHRDAMRRPVDMSTVCVLENPALDNDLLLEAVTDGVRRFGSQMRFLPAGEGPMVCSFTLTYEMTYAGDAVSGIAFQTFENGIPRMIIRGEVNRRGDLTTGAVKEYTRMALEKAAAAIKSEARIFSATTP